MFMPPTKAISDAVSRVDDPALLMMKRPDRRRIPAREEFRATAFEPQPLLRRTSKDDVARKRSLRRMAIEDHAHVDPPRRRGIEQVEQRAPAARQAERSRSRRPSARRCAAPPRPLRRCGLRRLAVDQRTDAIAGTHRIGASLGKWNWEVVRAASYLVVVPAPLPEVVAGFKVRRKAQAPSHTNFENQRVRENRNALRKISRPAAHSFHGPRRRDRRSHQ